MTLNELEMVKEEFDEISRSYGKSTSHQERLELIERVRTLLSLMKEIPGVQSHFKDDDSKQNH